MRECSPISVDRNYDGGLCCFAETVQAKFPVLKFTRKADLLWKTALWLRKDSEADEIMWAPVKVFMKFAL